MKARVKFCNNVTEMFESDEINENKIVFFWRGLHLTEWILGWRKTTHILNFHTSSKIVLFVV